MSDTSNAAKRHLELVHSQIDVGALTKTVLNFNGYQRPLAGVWLRSPSTVLYYRIELKPCRDSTPG